MEATSEPATRGARIHRGHQRVFPQTVVQTCIVHLIRHSLEFVSWKDRKTVMPALRAIYRAKDAEAGMKAMEEFEAGVWGQRYLRSPRLAAQLAARRALLRLSGKRRRIIYTTNAIEALNSKLRRAVRTRGHFPNDDAAIKLLYFVLNNAAGNGSGRRVSGSRPRPNSPSSSAKGSSDSDEISLTHRTPDSPLRFSINACPIKQSLASLPGPLR